MRSQIQTRATEHADELQKLQEKLNEMKLSNAKELRIKEEELKSAMSALSRNKDDSLRNLEHSMDLLRTESLEITARCHSLDQQLSVKQDEILSLKHNILEAENKHREDVDRSNAKHHDELEELKSLLEVAYREKAEVSADMQALTQTLDKLKLSLGDLEQSLMFEKQKLLENNKLLISYQAQLEQTNANAAQALIKHDLELKSLELNLKESHCKEITYLKKQMNDLEEQHNKAISMLKREHADELTIVKRAECQMRDELQQRITAMHMEMVTLREKLATRVSLPEDLATIDSLRQSLEDREASLSKHVDLVRHLRLELKNREETYNRIFNSRPQVGVVSSSSSSNVSSQGARLASSSSSSSLGMGISGTPRSSARPGSRK